MATNIETYFVEEPVKGICIRVQQTRGIDKEGLIEEIGRALEDLAHHGLLAGRELLLIRGVDPLWLPHLFRILNGQFPCRWVGVHETDGYHMIVSRDPRFQQNQVVPDEAVTLISANLAPAV